jgi:hypothetical protein
VAVVAGPVVLYVVTPLWWKDIAADRAVPATVITMAGAEALAWIVSLTQVIEISRDGIVLYRVRSGCVA